jgi:hypothetical protein
MYVFRTAVETRQLPPSDSWTLVDIDGIVPPSDERPDPGARPTTEQLKAQILSRLGAYFSADGEVEVRVELQKKRNGGEPVFVALPARRLTVDVLADLRSAFDSVAFFLLTGVDPPAPELEDVAVFLRPQLEQGAEARFCRIYGDNRDYLMQGSEAP